MVIVSVPGVCVSRFSLAHASTVSDALPDAFGFVDAVSSSSSGAQAAVEMAATASRTASRERVRRIDPEVPRVMA